MSLNLSNQMEEPTDVVKTLSTNNVCVTLLTFMAIFLSLTNIYITVITRERFPAGKTNLVWEVSF